MIRPTQHPLLLLGDAIHARDLRQLYEHEISAVVDLAANERPADLGHDHVYCRFPLHDDGSNSPQLLRATIDSLRSLLRNEIRTLVACSAGMSRSPVIAAAAVALMRGTSLHDALAGIVQGAPHDVSPAFLASVAAIHASILSADGTPSGG